MIIQEKYELDGDGGMFGTFWHDIDLEDLVEDRIMTFLQNLNASIGTQYRVIGTDGVISMLEIKQPLPMPIYIEEVL